MKALHVLVLGSSLALVACSNSGSSKSGLYHPDVGPFDENGDYVEALADAPVKKNFFSRSKSKKKSAPKVAKAKKPQKEEKKKVVVVTRTEPKPVARVTQSSRRVITTSPSTSSSSSGTRTAAVAAPVKTVAPAPRKVAVAPPKPAPVVMKPKKAAPLRHRVTSSDTLYGLSRRYGVSVSSIQRANGLKGTNIITGKTLLIPR